MKYLRTDQDLYNHPDPAEALRYRRYIEAYREMEREEQFHPFTARDALVMFTWCLFLVVLAFGLGKLWLPLGLLAGILAAFLLLGSFGVLFALPGTMWRRIWIRRRLRRFWRADYDRRRLP